MRASKLLVAVLAVGLGAAPSTLAARPGRAAAMPALAVIPFPGTPDASPSSQVIFSALRPSELRRVTVTGSRSGVHAGRLSVLPDGAGTAFVPTEHFLPGDWVTVHARLSSAQAGTASGDAGSTRLSFSFGVAQPLAEAAPAPAHASADRGSSALWQVFRSQPHLHPPKLRMFRSDPHGGDIFSTPVNDGQRGPMIVNGRGQLVWFHRTGGRTSFNFEKQSYRGRPVLTWWQGDVVHGHGAKGRDMILDSSYRTVAALRAGNGYSSDLHEFQLIPHGRALIDAFTVVPADLSSVGGPSNGRVLDCVIQELDIKTDRVLWEWHAYGHVLLSASYNWVPSDQTPFDFFHLNSIQQLSGNRLILSARNTWSAYMLDERTGRVIWTLGGKYSNWRMGPGTNFEWQHDIRLHRRGILTVFDDAAVPQEESESSAKELSINVHTGFVSLARRFTHSPPKLAGSQGNAQLLRGGRMMIGWGPGSGFSEYTPSGRLVLDGAFRLGVNSYRNYRYPWTGLPTHRPSLAVVPGTDGSMHLYASWNGATQVASWEVLAGSNRHHMLPITARNRDGFETAMHVYNEPRFLAVRALDGHGRTLRQSYVAPDPAHVAIFGDRAFASTSSRVADIPVACFGHGLCRLSIQVSAGHAALGPATSATLHSGRLALVPFTLSRAGLRRLTRARHRQLSVRVRVSRASGRGATRQLALVPYSTSGPSPARALSGSPTIRLLGSSEFVSSKGGGGILAACYGSVPCNVNAAISVGKTIIAHPSAEFLGADEAGYLPFRLTAAGRSMLSHASGNQLSARITLSNRNAVARGQVVLSRWG